MRTWGVTLAALGATGAIAVTAAGAAGGSSSATVKIPLPAPGQAKVSQITVKVTAPRGKHVGPLRVVAKNAAQLGTAQTNTQVVTAISPKSTKQRVATFKVWVFIHHWPAAPAADRTASAAEESNVQLSVSDIGGLLQVLDFVGSQSCEQLSHERAVSHSGTISFLKDDFGPFVRLEHEVKAFDTQTEEQLDGAVAAHPPPCPGAEDIQNDPPPF